MDYTILGRTGLKVSVMGLGAGGSSRVGQGTGKSINDSIDIIRKALDSGINIIDTAEFYRTENIVGEAIKNYDRESIILSTKKTIWSDITPKEVKEGFNNSLKNLNTDYIDIYHLHAVPLEDYDYIVEEILPTVLEFKNQGKVRHLGITERFEEDIEHEMLQRALKDDFWDVIMIGFNILNQSARQTIFPKTIEKNIGVLVMYAVRYALRSENNFRKVIKKLIRDKQIKETDINIQNPLDFLSFEEDVNHIIDAAY
ncbi:MAG: aldo/keto reductase, partial [Promethearchaeota archaeon]